MSWLCKLDDLEAQLGGRATLTCSLDSCRRRPRRIISCVSLASVLLIKEDVESLWLLGLLCSGPLQLLLGFHLFSFVLFEFPAGSDVSLSELGHLFDLPDDTGFAPVGLHASGNSSTPHDSGLLGRKITVSFIRFQRLTLLAVMSEVNYE